MAPGHRSKVMLLAAGALAIAIVGGAAQARTTKSPKFGVWILNANFISEFQGAALVKGGVRKPRLAFRIDSGLRPLAVTFDASRNLWVAVQGPLGSGGEIGELTPRQLGALAPGSPKRNAKFTVLLQDQTTDSPFLFPWGLGFDSDGDLWVSDFQNDIVMEFPPDQISKSGSPTPAVTITSPPEDPPAGLSFDNSDNMWVSWSGIGQVSGVDELLRFSPADRTASGPRNPSLILDMPPGYGTARAVFDAQGNLWVWKGPLSISDYPGMAMIPAAQLTGTGEIMASPTIIVEMPVFEEYSCPFTISFDIDPLGSLWVAAGSPMCSRDQQIDKFAADQLTAGATISPVVQILPNRGFKNFGQPGGTFLGPPVR
jgi:hypothetical protein